MSPSRMKWMVFGRMSPQRAEIAVFYFTRVNYIVESSGNCLLRVVVLSI